MSPFDTLLAETVNKTDVPHIVAEAVDNKGHVILSASAGYANATRDIPIAKDSVFYLASSTKLFTAIATLQCVDRGQISLDDDIATYLPEFAAPEVVTYHLPHRWFSPVNLTRPDGTPSFTLKPATTKITVRMLLTHTSGIGYEGLEPALTAWRQSRGESPQSTGGHISQLKMPLAFEPGTSWAYGAGIDWAGELVARVNNTTLGQYMQAHIFTPLGMTSTTFRPLDHPLIHKRLVSVHHRTRTGGLTTDGKPIFALPSADDWGGSGLYSTASDYAKVLADIISPTPTLLSTTSIALLFKPQLVPGSPSARDHAAHPATSGSATGLAKDRPDLEDIANISLGGRITTQDTPGWPKGTLSWGGISNTTWFANRELGVAGCTMVNTQPFLDAPSQALGIALREQAFALRDRARKEDQM